MSAGQNHKTTSTELRRVTSADGTSIALERVTEGPAVLVTVPGGPNGRRAWMAVAALLEGTHSCWLMDRRGKGDSGDTAPYSLEREYEDVAAAVDSFDAPVAVAGHSTGAVCALGAAAGGAHLSGLILYEPPWPHEGWHPPTAHADEMDELISAGHAERALERGLLMVGLTPAAIQAMRGGPGWADRVALVHTWPREIREVALLSPDLSPMRRIVAPTLLLDGEASPAHHRRATAAIAAALPTATVADLPGQGHTALQLAPQLVADAIRLFPAPVTS
jgi:alpha-beta hydrolase superfamily lysophospholipase